MAREYLRNAGGERNMGGVDHDTNKYWLSMATIDSAMRDLGYVLRLKTGNFKDDDVTETRLVLGRRLIGRSRSLWKQWLNAITVNPASPEYVTVGGGGRGSRGSTADSYKGSCNPIIICLHLLETCQARI